VSASQREQGKYQSPNSGRLQALFRLIVLGDYSPPVNGLHLTPIHLYPQVLGKFTRLSHEQVGEALIPIPLLGLVEAHRRSLRKYCQPTILTFAELSIGTPWNIDSDY